MLEEAAHLNESIFTEVVAPILGNKNVALLAISTPENTRGNYYENLLSAKTNEGKPLFRVIDLAAACRDCIKARKAGSCTHKLHVFPPWRPISQLARMQQMSGADDATFAQEFFGARMTNDIMLVDEKWIETLKSQVNFVTRKPFYPVVFTAIDPAGGGKPSDYAVTSVCIDDGNITVS